MSTTYTPQQLSAQASWIQYQQWLNSQYTINQRGYIISQVPSTVPGQTIPTPTTPQDAAAAPTYPFSLAAQNFIPNLPGWAIPIFGTVIVFLLVDVWPKVFFMPVVIGLIGLTLLWLTQPQ